MSAPVVVKKEKNVVATIKPHVPLLRSKTPKKQKVADNVDLEIFEGMSSIDAIRKLQALANLVRVKLLFLFHKNSQLCKNF